MSQFRIIFLINLGAFITAAGGVALVKLREGAEMSDLLSIRIFTVPWVYVIIPCYLIPVVLWFYLLKFIPLHVLQPALSIVYIYTFAMSYYILGSSVSWNHIVGGVVIFLGVLILSMKMA